MSQDLCILLASESTDMPSLLSNIEDKLSSLGFGIDPSFHRMTYNPVTHDFSWAECGFDVKDQDEISRNVEPIVLKSTLRDWDGVAANFVGREFSISMFLGKVKNSFSNCFIRISLQKLAELSRENAITKFYSAVLGISSAIKATAGFGDLEIDFIACSPEKAFAAIWEKPLDSTSSSSVGIVSLSSYSKEFVTGKAKDKFHISEWISGYLLLEENDYLDVVRSIR